MNAATIERLPDRHTLWTRRKKTLPALAIVLSALALSGVGTTVKVESENPQGITITNPDGAGGTALIVYHPGLSDFPYDVASAFGEGLVANGWRVEMTTASVQAPQDLGRYDLLVIATPTYWWTPARPALRYIDRLDSLDGKATAILITASGQPARSRSIMEAHIRQKGGALVASLALTAWKPNRQNDARPNSSVALEMAREAGRAIPASCPKA